MKFNKHIKMIYLILFFMTTLALSEYFYKIYKESKYYKEDVVFISYTPIDELEFNKFVNN